MNVVGLYFVSVESGLTLICIIIIILLIIHEKETPVPFKLRKIMAFVGKILLMKPKHETKPETNENGTPFLIYNGKGLKAIHKQFENWMAVDWNFTTIVIQRWLFIIFFLLDITITSGFLIFGLLIDLQTIY